MSSGNTGDDDVPGTYPYFWESGSNVTLQEFLTKVMVYYLDSFRDLHTTTVQA